MDSDKSFYSWFVFCYITFYTILFTSIKEKRITMGTKVVIIGAGPGGHAAAVEAARLGAEVTLIEKDSIGGTCLNRGCIPSKIMKKTAEALAHFKNAPEFGIDINGTFSLNIERLMERKQKVISTLAKGMAAHLETNKINYLKGHGYIKAPNLAGVDCADGRSKEVPYDRLILSPGTQSLELTLCPFDGDRIMSGNEALSLSEIPRSLLIVGGGVIGCEFAFILNALGAKVTVVESMSRLLPLDSVDEDCSKVIRREMKKVKIDVLTQCTVTHVEQQKDKIQVSIGPSVSSHKPESKKSAPKNLQVDKVLVCIGRKPDTEDIGLNRIDVKTDKNGWIVADDYMKTNAAGVYAVGDILGPSRIMLAHTASAEGQVAAKNALGKNKRLSYDIIPSAIFTMPETANVGLTEQQAKEQGYQLKSDSILFRALGKAHVIDEIAGFAKIVSDSKNGKILGVHIVGPHATDLIAEGTLAMEMGCTVEDLAGTIHAHPTLAEIMWDVSLQATEK